MSDFEEVKLNNSQFQEWQKLETIRNNTLWRIAETISLLTDHLRESLEIATADNGKWLSLQNDTIKAGFESVVEALQSSTLPPPQPQPTGVIMARFKVAADNPDFEIVLTGSGFTDSEGNPTGASDIDLSGESSNPDALSVSIIDQVLSDDGQNVTTRLSAHVGSPSPDMAAVGYKAVNRDTGAVVATGSDEFLVNAGEAGIGTVTSSVPLRPEPEV